MSDDEKAFLHHIRLEPGDDTPRLVYADWLQENGKEGRARFIRESIDNRLSVRYELSPSPHDRTKTEWVPFASTDGGPYLPLTKFNRPRWLPDPTKDLQPLLPGEFFHRDVVVYDRGFISSIRLTVYRFQSAASVLFDSHPIVEVDLSDKQCVLTGGHCWQKLSVGARAWGAEATRSGRIAYMIPDEIYSFLPFRDPSHRPANRDDHFVTYPPDRDTGLSWLSHACVDWARDKVGLPLLYTAERTNVPKS